jgi:hypothetical protein
MLSGQYCLSASWDTTYYKKYDKRLIVSLYQSQRKYAININRIALLNRENIATNYEANARRVTGADISFDKFSFSFGLLTQAPDSVELARRGNTDYLNLAFAFGDNYYRVENSYRKYTGFFDLNSSRYTPDFVDSSSVFFQNPQMVSEQLMIKTMFFNKSHRFSYQSAYSCIYRQLKSSITLSPLGNFYYLNVYSPQSLIPPALIAQYPNGDLLRGLKVFGYSIGMGFSANIVIAKAFFLNLSVWPGFEYQFRKYDDGAEDNRYKIYPGTFVESRAALGFNFKNFFVSVSSFNDGRIFSRDRTSIQVIYISGNFTIAYRFPVKEREWMRKVRESKIYSFL